MNKNRVAQGFPLFLGKITVTGTFLSSFVSSLKQSSKRQEKRKPEPFHNEEGEKKGYFIVEKPHAWSRRCDRGRGQKRCKKEPNLIIALLSQQ